VSHRHGYNTLDVRRDVPALYRSALTRDATARDAILAGTDWPCCLTLGVLAFGLGVVLDLGPPGWDIEEGIVGALAELAAGCA